MNERTRRTADRVYGRDILEGVYEMGVNATYDFIARNGRLQTMECRRVFDVPPKSTNIIHRGCWGELATKYDAWAQMLKHHGADENKLEEVLASLLQSLDEREEHERAFRATGHLLLEEQHELTKHQLERYYVQYVALLRHSSFRALETPQSR